MHSEILFSNELKLRMMKCTLFFVYICYGVYINVRINFSAFCVYLSNCHYIILSDNSL